jgi:hypothetical protein
LTIISLSEIIFVFSFFCCANNANGSKATNNVKIYFIVFII